jgi:predicted  nucleic acid-binding Zn-ribbon protein
MMQLKNTDVIFQLMNKARESQAEYKKNVENFQTSRHVLTQQVKTVLETLSIEALDTLIAKTRKEMVGSWTTAGMKKGMGTFFEGAKYTMEQVSWQADKSNELVEAVYQRFREDHDLKDIKPVLYSTKKYSAQLARLFTEAEAFRNSSITTMTEQSFVIKKFFVSLVSHARNIFFQARQDAEVWAKSVMTPLATRIKDRKKQLEQHLDSLRKIKSSREKLEEKIQELEAMCTDLEDQISTIDSLLEGIYSPLPELGGKSNAAQAEKVAV